MATLYCGPSNTGNGSGSNFSNLLALPNTTGFTRGNTYIIVDGSYGSKTLSTATSGSTTITIKKASAADSAVTGYNANLHDGEATFGSISVASKYWVINGVTRTETALMGAPAGYGIRASSLSGTDAFVDADTASNSQFSYMDIGGTYDAGNTPVCSQTDSSAIRFVYVHHDIVFSRCIFHNRGSNNSAIAMMHGSSGITWDHCDFYHGWGKATIAAPNAGCQTWTVRYCRFWNSSRLDSFCGSDGGGITCEVGAYGNDLNPNGIIVHGCTFYGTASGGRNAVLDFAGSGFSNSVATNCKVFNNTFVGFPESPVLSHIYFYGGSGNEARNNLFWDVAGSMAITVNTASNNVDATVNPFVDYANRDFRITSGSQARNVGYNVGSPYNTDPLGVTRGADGTWDVGAYEYSAGGATPPLGTPILSVR